MKFLKILLLGTLFFTVNGFAAEQTTIQPGQAAHKDPHSAGTYSWQRCVEDHMKEGGHSQEEAYKKCEGLQ